jgi:hypothetical protein
MAIGYVGYDPSETKVPIRGPIACEHDLDRDVARASIRMFHATREGAPTSPLFGLEAKASLFARHQDNDGREGTSVAAGKSATPASSGHRHDRD